MDVNLQLKKVPCDVFSVMRRSKSLLGYYNAGYEDEQCVGNLYTRFLKYKEQHHLQSPDPIFSPAFSGGFLIFDSRLISSSSYIKFINFIVDTKLIYTTRLSDQVIFSYAINLLTSNKYIHQFSGFVFNHVGSWGNNDVYTDKTHPIWHINGVDSWCVENQGVVPVAESHYWNYVRGIRKKNNLLRNVLKHDESEKQGNAEDTRKMKQENIEDTRKMKFHVYDIPDELFLDHIDISAPMFDENSFTNPYVIEYNAINE